jgi:hypothetical protein
MFGHIFTTMRRNSFVLGLGFLDLAPFPFLIGVEEVSQRLLPIVCLDK